MVTFLNKLYGRSVKRFMDLLLATFLLLLLWPLMLIVAITLALSCGRPVIFTQTRIGRDERPFNMLKFRSMTDEKDDDGHLLPSNKRVTRFGKLLRTTSLDELPELINIFRGDMSFIGPRPLLPEYLNYYEEWERERHNVRPGLTGYAQVKGRNMLLWRERFAFDQYYVHHLSFVLDLKIIFWTIRAVVKREGIADMREVKTDEFGDYILHQGRKFRPLNEEREYEKHLRQEGLLGENEYY